MTCMIGDVIAWRSFRRVVREPSKIFANESKAHRKYSCPM